METDVVDFIEDAVTSIEGVKQISSTSRQGSASVNIEFDLSRNIDVALQDVQTKVAQAARRLPREMDPPIITKRTPRTSPSCGSRWRATGRPLHGRLHPQRAQPQFQTIEGVGEIQLGGYRERSHPRLVRRAAPGGAGPDRAGRDRGHRARAQGSAGRAHRDGRARDERARGGRGRGPRGLPRPRHRLQPGGPVRLKDVGRGRGRPRGPPPHGPRQRRARGRLRHQEAARGERGRGRPERPRPRWPPCARRCPKACR